MKKILFVLLILCSIFAACTKNNKNVKQAESSQIEKPVSLYKHILDINDNIQIMRDSINLVFITKFNENKQIVIICDKNNYRSMSQLHCEQAIIYGFTKRITELDRKIKWLGVLESGATRYAEKITGEYDEYYKQTFTRVYTTYESLYGWLNV